MTFLRDRWRRGPVYKYFADMAPIDRATAIIVLALLLAWSFAFAVIVRHREPQVELRPSLTAPPFELQFAAAPVPT